MRIRTFRIDLGKKLSSGLEHSIGGGSRFCVLGSRVFQEIWVADFAMQVEERLAWGCGIWLLGAGWVPAWRLLSTKLNQWRVGSWIVTLLPVTEFWVGRASSRGVCL